IEIETGKPSDAYARFRDLPRLPYFSWDGKRYYLPDADGSVYTFYDAATHKQIAAFDFRAHGIAEPGSQRSPSGDLRLWAAPGKERDAFYLWDVESGRRLVTFKFPASVKPSAWQLSYDGRTALFAVEPDSLYVFHLPNPPAPKGEEKPQVKADPPIIQPLHRIRWPQGRLYSVGLSPDNRYFSACTLIQPENRTGGARVWHLDTGKLYRELPPGFIT